MGPFFWTKMTLSPNINSREFDKFRDVNGGTVIAVKIEEGGSNSPSYKTLVDEVSSTLSYVGEASPGVDTSSSLWRIKKIQTIGQTTSVLYATGSADFSNIWDDRASLTYS